MKKKKISKPKATRRFQILLKEEEWEILQRESQKRGLSASEFIRKGIFAETLKVNSLQRIQALKNLSEILS